MKRLKAITLALGLSLLITSPAFAYTVKSGDTMGELAEEYNISLHELSRLNPQVKDIDLIIVGEVLEVGEKDAEDTVPKVAPVVKTTATDTEVNLLARLVRAEAQGESFAGKVAVAEVVLNRVESDDFPDSIGAVIYQSGQFSPVSNGSINKAPDEASIKAVEQALQGSNTVGKALFFYNYKTATSRWLDSRQTVTVIGNHTFKY